MKKRSVCMILAVLMAVNSVDVSVLAEEIQGGSASEGGGSRDWDTGRHRDIKY